MNRLLFTDTHFTDKPIDDYRWKLFSFLREIARKYDVRELYCLGDLVDTKDRFTGDFVNFLVECFCDLKDYTGAEITILAGNHDKPLNEPYYWEFLNKSGINYITKPAYVPNILLLPFSGNAVEDWKEHFKLLEQNPLAYKALFMHQTVEGAVIEDDRRIPSNPHPLPPLPDIPIYSGDVHRPQKLGDKFFYVGAPYPVRFSETWSNRIFLIENDDFEHPVHLNVPTIKRAILDIKSSKDIVKTSFKANDQIKIRYQLEASKMESYPEEESKIKKWAEEKGIMIVSLEPFLIGEGIKTETAQQLDLKPPKEVLEAFSKQENLSQETIAIGEEILKESM